MRTLSVEGESGKMKVGKTKRRKGTKIIGKWRTGR
jgi:hypothetical protein